MPTTDRINSLNERRRSCPCVSPRRGSNDAVFASGFRTDNRRRIKIISLVSGSTLPGSQDLLDVFPVPLELTGSARSPSRNYDQSVYARGHDVIVDGRDFGAGVGRPYSMAKDRHAFSEKGVRSQVSEKQWRHILVS